jgi:hypothetical protein
VARRANRLLDVLDPLTAVAALVLVLGTVQLFAGALEAGVTLDEPLHVERAASWIDNGWYVPERDLADGRPDPDKPAATPYVYGPAFEAVAHLANFAAGNEALDEISHSAGAYSVRHLTVALLALLAAAAVGFAVSLLTRSPRFGVWAAAGLLAVPEWTGQGFFNPKDTPVAAGYTLVTVALVLALRGAPAERRRTLAIGALLAGGIFIGIGTRLALWAPFAASLLTYAALRLGQWRLGRIAPAGNADVAVGAGAGIGVAAIALVYPNVAKSPLSLLTESVSGSSNFPWQGTTLTAGHLLPEHPPWWYLPTWVGASYPLLLAGLVLLGAVLGIRGLVRARGTGWHGELWARPDLGLALVLQQALLLPLVAILGGSVMYSGMRQHIYVLPAMAMLAGVGAQRLWAWSRSRQPQDTWRPVATGLLCAALLIPMAEQALLFPYNYAYVNAVAGIGGVNDRWESDYWMASAPEALSHVPRDAPLRCFLVPPSVSCYADQIKPFEDRQGTDVQARWHGDSSATWAIVRRHAGNQLPYYCEQVDNVTRWLRGETVTMAYVLRCDPERLGAAGPP